MPVSSSVGDPPTTVPRPRRWLARAALVLAGLVVALLGVEVALAQVHSVVREARLPDVSAVHGDTVLCLGDSVTFGLGVDGADAWPAQLAARLATRGLDVPVLNLGMPGERFDMVQFTVQERLKWLPADARPLVVVMMGHNDFNPIARTESSKFAIARLFAWIAYATDESMPPLPPTTPDRMAEGLAAVHHWAVERGGSVWVAGYPVPGEWSGWDPRGMGAYVAQVRPRVLAGNEILARMAAREQVPFLDVHTAGQFPGTYDSALFVDSIHLTRAGNGRVSEVVSTTLGTELEKRNRSAAAPQKVGGL